MLGDCPDCLWMIVPGLDTKSVRCFPCFTCRMRVEATARVGDGFDAEDAPMIADTRKPECADCGCRTVDEPAYWLVLCRACHALRVLDRPPEPEPTPSRRPRLAWAPRHVLSSYAGVLLGCALAAGIGWAFRWDVRDVVMSYLLVHIAFSATRILFAVRVLEELPPQEGPDNE